MNKSLSEPLDDEELVLLDEFLLDRMDDETSDRIAAAGGDEGILGTEEGWGMVDTMSDADQAREQDGIFESVRALHRYWLERRALQSAPIRRAAPKVGRNDPCPCGSGKKYKHCCLQ